MEGIAAPKEEHIYGAENFIKVKPKCPTGKSDYVIGDTSGDDWAPVCPDTVEGHELPTDD